ncbi:hypothetical protein DM02DRAFT_653636 [Periconia macrospinosa]|uniref:Uncharacterized protein n=1 Tax=Periconia macrospinosa TaxID=97972 RepID=A0A2V1DWB5_9PLEO|nr:hypothetical protein DM02DRAFT_653636 [Periconia macrospinosa]
MSANNALNLSQRETELLAATWQCFEGGQPKVNFVKLAAITGYTEGSARYALGQLKTKIKKHGATDNTGGAAAAPVTPKKPTTPKAVSRSGGKRSAGKASAQMIDDTPTKKQKVVIEKDHASSEMPEQDEEELKVKSEIIDDNDNFDRNSDDLL